MEEAMLWTREGKQIRCELCARRCLIPEGKKGYCGVRVNKKGRLYSKNFGRIVFMDTDPIEKKPMFHFFPGSQTLSLASVGCNFKCKFCLNWQISQTKRVTGEKYTPEDIIKMARDKQIKIIAFTYTEPTVCFEFAYRVARLAKRYNIKTVFVTNGYMTSDAVKKIGKYLDAVTVDFKASGDPEFYKKYMDVPDVNPIFSALKAFKKHRVFTEISNLIFPKIGDKPEFNQRLVDWIINNLSSAVPYHLLRFSPAFKMGEVPSTPVETLEKFAVDAKKLGLRYVYVGNVWGSEYENTFCYNCGKPVILRTGFMVNKIDLIGDRCPECGYKIDVIIQ